MLVTLSRRTSNCKSVAEVLLAGIVSLAAVSHGFDF